MKKDYSIYKYYKGEKLNPFNIENENSAYMFWGYELFFEELYNNGNYKKGSFNHIAFGQEQEFNNVIKFNPASKEELFKLWLYHLLSDYLPSKGGYSYEALRDLYFNS